MSKLLDEMIEEVASEIMEKNKDIFDTFTKKEVLMFCKGFVIAVSKLISKQIKDFVKKEIKKGETKND